MQNIKIIKERKNHVRISTLSFNRNNFFDKSFLLFLLLFYISQNYLDPTLIIILIIVFVVMIAQVFLVVYIIKETGGISFS
jgi:hypothetical protein